MTLNVTIVTTANRSLKYTQTDEAAVRDLLGSLRTCGQFFTNRTMIIGSAAETQIISPSSLTRIEIETQLDLGAYVPQLKDTPMTLITADTNTPPSAVSDTYISTRVNCFFDGGDTVAIWLSGPRPTNNSDRMLRMTRLFEQAVLVCKLPQGGVGFLNPARMTRAQFDTAADTLPASAWRLNPAG